MIELDDLRVVVSVAVNLIDTGFIQRPSTGAGPTRIDRPGSRFAAEIAFREMTPDEAARLATRLLRARRLGLRVRLPLLRPQGAPGAPLVDGRGQGGTTLALRNVTPGWVAKENYRLTVIEAATGLRCLHKIAAPAVAGIDGRILLEIEPALRLPLADGDMVELARPTIEGFVISELSEGDAVDRLVRLPAVTLEEAA